LRLCTNFASIKELMATQRGFIWDTTTSNLSKPPQLLIHPSSSKGRELKAPATNTSCSSIWALAPSSSLSLEHPCLVKLPHIILCILQKCRLKTPTVLGTSLRILELSQPLSHIKLTYPRTPIYPPQTNQRTPLTLENLRRVPLAPSNRQTYLSRDQNFERVSLCLPTQRKSGADMVREWEEGWRRVSGERVDVRAWECIGGRAIGRMWGNNWSIGGSFANMERFHIILHNYLGRVRVDHL